MSPKSLLLLYLTTIILLLALPLNGTNAFLSDNYIVEIRLDYLGHIFLFGPFLFLITRSFAVKVWLAILIGAAFASGSEGLQYLLPYRTYNVNDLLSNMLGILFGLLFLLPAINTFLSRLLFRSKR